jgi:hypothetical protein
MYRARLYPHYFKASTLIPMVTAPSLNPLPRATVRLVCEVYPTYIRDRTEFHRTLNTSVRRFLTGRALLHHAQVVAPLGRPTPLLPFIA